MAIATKEEFPVIKLFLKKSSLHVINVHKIVQFATINVSLPDFSSYFKDQLDI